MKKQDLEKRIESDLKKLEKEKEFDNQLYLDCFMRVGDYAGNKFWNYMDRLTKIRIQKRRER